MPNPILAPRQLGLDKYLKDNIWNCMIFFIQLYVFVMWIDVIFSVV